MRVHSRCREVVFSAGAGGRKGRTTIMAMTPLLTQTEVEELRGYDTCMVANAVEAFNVRLRNTGFTDASIRCMFEDAPPMVGYAVTARLRSGEPPMRGGVFRDRSEFWKSILMAPAPRILVLQDMDEMPGRGAFIGDVHASILHALSCVGCVTNGAVRELPAVRALGLQLFAGNVAVSHAYAHIFDLGIEITIGGMEVRTGDLLHGDRHGVLNVPLEIAAKIAATARVMKAEEQKVIEFCRSGSFSIPGLTDLMKKKSI